MGVSSQEICQIFFIFCQVVSCSTFFGLYQIAGYLLGRILWHLCLLHLMSKEFIFLRLFSGCFAISDGKPYVRSISDQCMEILFVCKAVTWTLKMLNTSSRSSRFPETETRGVHFGSKNFHFLPKNGSILKWEAATGYQNWKKVTNFSLFTREKSLSIFGFSHFRWLPGKS